MYVKFTVDAVNREHGPKHVEQGHPVKKMNFLKFRRKLGPKIYTTSENPPARFHHDTYNVETLVLVLFNSFHLSGALLFWCGFHVRQMLVV